MRSKVFPLSPLSNQVGVLQEPIWQSIVAMWHCLPDGSDVSGTLRARGWRLEEGLWPPACLLTEEGGWKLDGNEALFNEDCLCRNQTEEESGSLGRGSCGGVSGLQV